MVIDMIIYHGSIVAVDTPKILHSNRKLDFGEGFYTTSNREQAVSWAQTVAARRETAAQFISVYEFGLKEALMNLSVVRFDEPDEAWLDFICMNRGGREKPGWYDMVLGPVADDNVYAVVQFYENGVYDKDEALKRLKVEKLYDQILFHTEKSLAYCRFLSCEALGGSA